MVPGGEVFHGLATSFGRGRACPRSRARTGRGRGLVGEEPVMRSSARRWSGALPRNRVEALVGYGIASPRPRRRSWTLGERFQVMMLSGRSASQRASTSPMARARWGLSSSQGGRRGVRSGHTDCRGGASLRCRSGAVEVVGDAGAGRRNGSLGDSGGPGSSRSKAVGAVAVGAGGGEGTQSRPSGQVAAAGVAAAAGARAAPVSRGRPRTVLRGLRPRVWSMASVDHRR